MLYCKGCNYVVDVGRNSCANCGNGFVSALVCGTCGNEVPRGSASCGKCDRHRVDAGVVPYAGAPAPPPAGLPPGAVSVTIMPFVPPSPSGGGGLVPFSPLDIPALATGLPTPVRSSYEQNRFGVAAEVQLGGRDAEILTKMKQAAALLHVLAQEMNNLQGHMPSTRAVIKSCRNLASDLQEEVEVRLGPQG